MFAFVRALDKAEDKTVVQNSAQSDSLGDKISRESQLLWAGLKGIKKSIQHEVIDHPLRALGNVGIGVATGLV